MKRIAGLLVAAGAVLFAVGPVAALQLPVASLNPKTGLAGTEITVTVSQYSPEIVIEVHENTVNGTLIGTGMTDGSGTGAFPITIPASAPTGSYLMYICGLCTSQFPEWATRGFQVTGPAPTTTTVASTTTVATTPPTTTTAPSTTEGSTTTTVVTPPTTVVPGNEAATAPPSDSGEFSRGLLVGLIVALSVALLVIVGLVIASGKSARRGAQPPAPRPPPPPTG